MIEKIFYSLIGVALIILPLITYRYLNRRSKTSEKHKQAV